MPYDDLPRTTRLAAGLAVLGLVAVTLAGCAGADRDPGDGPADAAAETTGVAGGKTVVRTNVRAGATDVPVDKVLRVVAENATLRSVVVRSAGGRLPGELVEDGARWVASDRLEPGIRYRVRAVAAGADGERVRNVSSFTTAPLTLDQQTYPSVAPLDGETVGIGMPVVVRFDVPVTDKATFEKHMRVSSSPRQAGSWRWVSDNEARWRPRRYWKAGTDVSVDIDVNGLHAGGGIYGQEDRRVDFQIGDAHVYRVDAAAHRMKVFENGRLLRTFPITTGKPGFTTRSGVKVIMGKHERKRMNSETVGIPSGSAEAYDIANVRWAMRLTSSGEFIHAAPWSVGSQGRANVSHGCTGMSTEDAGWLYAMSRRGDVVEYTGTDRPMEPDNGYGDWNLAWADYVEGSALQ
ncbi:Ig-like domain-containing protein [Nocardioides sp. SYSU DS0651]|uniref:L,D-transpeptidase n=1 Tax=Nocardioides sp. SYSU DS0651 TaxID=3415955 RepID=UPI003F4BE375